MAYVSVVTATLISSHLFRGGMAKKKKDGFVLGIDHLEIEMEGLDHLTEDARKDIGRFLIYYMRNANDVMKEEFGIRIREADMRFEFESTKHTATIGES